MNPKTNRQKLGVPYLPNTCLALFLAVYVLSKKTAMDLLIHVEPGVRRWRHLEVSLATEENINAHDWTVEAMPHSRRWIHFFIPLSNMDVLPRVWSFMAWCANEPQRIRSNQGEKTIRNQGSRAQSMQRTCRGPSSAVSKPIFQLNHIKSPRYSFCNNFECVIDLYTSAPLQLNICRISATFPDPPPIPRRASRSTGKKEKKFPNNIK